MGAGMIMLGAFVASTQLVAVDSLVTAMRASLPPHRQQLAEKNVQLLNQGAEYVRSAWRDSASRTRYSTLA